MQPTAYAEPKAIIPGDPQARASPSLLMDVHLTPDEARRVHGYVLMVGGATPYVFGPGNSRGDALWHTTDAPGGPQRCTLVHNGAGHTYTVYVASYAPGETQVYILSYAGDRVAWRPMGSLDQPVSLTWRMHAGVTNHFELCGVPPECAESAAQLARTPWAMMHHAAVRPPAALPARMPPAGACVTPFLCVPRAGATPVLITPAAAQRGVWTLVFAGGAALAAPSIDSAAQTDDGTWYAPLRCTLPIRSTLGRVRGGELHDERVAREVGAHDAAALHDAHPALLVLRPARGGAMGMELLCINDSTEHPWLLTHRTEGGGGHGAVVAWETTMTDAATARRVHSRAANVLSMHRRKRYDAHGVRGDDKTVQVMVLDVPQRSTMSRTVAAVHDISTHTVPQWHSTTEYRGVGSVYAHAEAPVLASSAHAHGAAFTYLPRLLETHDAQGNLIMAHSKQLDFLTPRAACVLHAVRGLPHSPVHESLHANVNESVPSFLYDGAGRAL
uniref:Uncharacterized protein n=1 Tax=viral metagenome TaxID=1070528 RepID=A0A6C0ASR2_9ZZZZ